ncbi:MAG TPA: hypothetical protein VGR28_11580 [Candidatus Thermoplasmatota archaeon]|jgi:hypothetical protein|nr:hypothetical protein [Candidatus Thermoplasmatota archaeon]
MRAALLLLLATLATALPASATIVEVGASGQCYDAAGNGGEDALGVAADTNDPAGATVVLPTLTGAVAALDQALSYYTEDSAGCNDAATRRSPDYIEAHARVDATFVQVCYDDRATNVPDPLNLDPGAVHTDGTCPTTPAPAGP